MADSVRSVMPGVAVMAAAAATALAIAAMPRPAPLTTAFGAIGAPAPEQREAAPRAVLSSVTADRLSAVMGQKYGLRFGPGGRGDRVSDRVEESSARLEGDGRLDVVLFGGLPRSVHAMACEVARVDQQRAADLLSDCAGVAAGDGAASVVSSWIRCALQMIASGGGASHALGATRYALRAVPASRTWVLSMSADGA